MSDAILNKFVAFGSQAEREAFTPDAPEPPSGPRHAYFWYQDDGDLYSWNFDGSPAGWELVTTSGGGISQLTGDVTAGPGAGSQAATIANDAVTNAKLANMAQATIKGRAAAAGTGDPTDLSKSQAQTILGIGTTTLGITIDGGGAVIATGVHGDLRIPFACTITKATVLADQDGDIVIDVWKDTYANFPPTVADTITASAKPTLSGASKSEDSTLTGWTTSISAGDVLRFNVDSAATVTRVVLQLDVTY